ncbi:transmembrane protein 11, mitochondrial-like [Mya arenaria]|uniref:transmembrane protein 11, mitochondrial-like n=1 Tax=Mya arenaria TaxID=6604 RepID=UPI0022DFB812|nr:transmembrane protein 11, mitochondrial-like [Mya arenaria]
MAATTARTRSGRPPEYVIIRDVNDSDLTQEDLEEELERAFDEEAEVIVIEPVALGNEVVKWISFGNFLHKSCVLSGFACLTLPIVSKSDIASLVCGAVSVSCASVYALSWQRDPMCKYQKTMNLSDLEHVVQSLNSVNPVVLIRRDDSRRKKLHNVFAVLSGILCGFKLYCLIRPN